MSRTSTSNGRSHSTGEQIARQNVQTITDLERAAHRKATFGEVLADRLSAIVGSWSFIVAQFVLLTLWITLNLAAWIRHWDPFPFILLNLTLSCVTAFAGPIIMMSQKRAAHIADRRNQLDLQINLLAEQENTEMLRMLHLICQRLDVPIPDRATVARLEEETKPAKVVHEIDRSENAAASKHQVSRRKARLGRRGTSENSATY